MKLQKIKSLMLLPVVMLAIMIFAGFTTQKEAITKLKPQDINRDLIGDWEDTDTKAITSIREQDGALAVVSVIDDDHEVFVVLESKMENGTFKWAYKVPSTGYVVNCEVKNVSGDTMNVHWSNNNTSGEQGYKRVNQ